MNSQADKHLRLSLIHYLHHFLHRIDRESLDVRALLFPARPNFT